ncbi:MAG: bifunctional phosphopantothenoylcysteine decarboxylase/phosphopantothenate--cysteine ligase CoaBC [Deltaproteobacteria bacterium]|nr:bifunctional phosphopantothenoylcysteine decarboxylase/phosphopantothenate--cysteine ligase CoaBC [Deltaproteobacteria bacterium]
MKKPTDDSRAPVPGAGPSDDVPGGDGRGRHLSDPLDILRGRRILLAVTGGVAAYKAAELARLMTRAGALVRVVMTEAAARFVAPLTFSSLTGEGVGLDMWAREGTEGGGGHVRHVAWAEWAELLVTAPATADFLAKLAHGLAGDLASTISLAYAGPRVTAPAMNAGMYLNPATRANLETLNSRGHRILGSPEGLLACGTSGPGRMAEPLAIALEAARALGGGRLKGKKVVVTGGASREGWDDIRFLSNRSSGKMGLSLAMSAWLMGAEVVYLASPAALFPAVPLEGLKVALFETTQSLLDLLTEIISDAAPWALAMNAAPADYAPAERVRGKISKSGEPVTEIKLARTPDILTGLGPVKGSCLFLGFAAEEADLEEKARGKLLRKNLDFIAANRAGGPDSAFGSETTRLLLISKTSPAVTIGPAPKFQAAWDLWEAVASA